MSKAIEFTKEVTYKLEYKGEIFELDHYIDNIENRRYVLYYFEQLEEPAPLNIKGTENPYQVIEPELLGETKIEGAFSTFRLYRLPDVPITLVAYIRENRFGIYHSWSFKYMNELN